MSTVMATKKTHKKRFKTTQNNTKSMFFTPVVQYVGS